MVDAVEEIKKNILIINGLIMKVRIKNPIWGVPITFLYKYCPTQFEIVKFRKGDRKRSGKLQGQRTDKG